MKHLKLFFALFAMLALGVGNAWADDVTFSWEGSATADGGKTDYVVEQAPVTLTFAVGTASNAPRTNKEGSVRMYANTTLTISCASGNITKVTFTPTGNSYRATNLQYNGTALTSDEWTLSSPSNEVTLTASANARFKTIVVTYTPSGGSETPKQKYTLTYQAGSVTGSLEVEEGANLLDALEDITPVACDPTSTEPIGWSESEITTKQANAPTLLTDASVMPSKEHSVYYVFAKKETTGGGAATEKTGTYTFSSYAAGTQYAKNEEHKLDDDVTIYTNDCHFTSELRIYSSSSNNGYVVSNELPGKIVSMGFNAGNKVDVLVVYGSTDGSEWTQVGEVSVTSTSYKDYELSFGATNYTYFKLDVKGSNQVRLQKMSVTYMSGGGTTTISDYTTSCGTAPEPAVLVSIVANAEGKNAFTEGDEFVKATITATYDDETTKDVTSLATFTGYDMNTTGTQTVNVTYEGKSTSYTITVNPKPKYTITWNNAGTTTTTEVVQGEALGTLPEPADCPFGKKFMGWTAATSVNNDGSGITYIKTTDKPTANTTYYAVFAVVEGGDETPTTATVTIADYATANSWASGTQYNTMNIDANITATAAGGGNTGKYYSSGSGTWRFYQNETPSLTISAAAGYEIQTVKMTYTIGNTGVLTLDGSQIASEAACEINAVSVTFSVGNTTSATNGNVQVSAIEVVYAPAAAKSDYSLDCELHQDPYLTVLETAIGFGTVAQNETATETFTVTGGYLAEDVALTISGTNASFFSVSPATIAKADDVEETVTVTYNPTATGDHTATLTIKTGDITKEIALSGKVLAPGKWVLVKDVATLSAGDEIIIASAVADYAIGVAATNNYKGAAITKVGETANTTADVTILTVEATGDAEVPYAFKDGSKYLYAASNSANQLKAQSTNNANGQWAITITAEGVASIVAAKSSNRNVMQCNPNGGSPIFACYSSADYEALAIYRNSENVVKPVISGDADFVGSTQVTITAQSGLTVYYTTDGTDPNNTSVQYTEPFTINATTTVKAIAYDASSNASSVAEMTFTKHELVNVADAMALAEDEVAYFDEFEVVKVVTGKGNIYIKDASGHGLIYDNTLASELKDGDRVQGFVGISAPYNGLPEAKPVDGLTVADLSITSGTPTDPYDYTSTAITANDLNKYIVFKEVPMDADVDVTTHPTLTINGNSVNFRNSFNVTKTLENGKKYDIYGFVSIFNENLQVSFYQALEQGEVVKTYTVTYNAGGATGTVPVDDNEYTAGAQVYLKSATGLTKEGYEYKGWKVTDEGGNEIAVSSNKFNMPASNVTATAQWEEIVVTTRQDFSAGYWVLVTDASELADDDYIIVAAADENYAMKSYESGNNCKQLEITKLGDQLLKWTSEIGVFQLAANGTNYTIQDVNSEEYLYAAGTGNNNYLKAADEVPADADAAKPYIWTISYTDGVATVKATSDNRNTLMYNTGSDLFACYASGQKDIALYKYVDTYTYTRNVTNKFGTICLPYASASTTGAYFYQVKGKEEGKVYLESVNALEAGVPYIFEAIASTITVTYTGEAVVAPVNTNANGLIGTFVEIEVPNGDYILYGDKFCTNNDSSKPNNKIRANRAYLDMDAVQGGAPQQMPGRRYIGMSVQGENEATGFDNIQLPNANSQKLIINGQLIIIRDGEMYNAQGQKL